MIASSATSNRARLRAEEAAQRPATIAALEARLAAMPSPQVSREEIGMVERALMAGAMAIPGASLDVHRVLTRRIVERMIRRERVQLAADRRRS